MGILHEWAPLAMCLLLLTFFQEELTHLTFLIKTLKKESLPLKINSLLNN